MKKTIYIVLICALTLGLSAVSNAQGKSSNNLITSDSAGAVRLGMTVAQARKKLKGMILERATDGEGLALIAVKKGGKTLMTFYAGEENPESKIDEQAKIEQIEVWDKSYRTAKGVYAGMLVRNVEKIYGKVRQIILSEMESREYAAFANHPKGVDFRLMNDNSTAGIYADRQATTTKYGNDTYLLSILVTGKASLASLDGENTATRFSSIYSGLQTGCKSEGGEEGGHVSTFCKGTGNYRIHIFDSATTLEFLAETLDRQEAVNLASQALDYDTKNRKIEWRLADGMPFAVIMRTNKYKTENDLIAYPTKKTGEFLIVKGLKGFERIDFEVNAGLPNANIKARALADNAFAVQSSRLEP